MKNEIGRKITSLTLMTIMLAGGMTIAFPGFTPDAYAVNANLIVSAEKTGGNIDGAQIVEIVVIDNDLDNDVFPDVTVSGVAVAMVRASDGWYAYIADTGAVAEVDNNSPAVVSGIDFGVLVETAPDGTNTCLGTAVSSDSTTIYCDSADVEQNVPAAVKDAQTTGELVWPFIQTYDFSSTVEVRYNKGGNTQTETFKFTDDATGISLDRTNYPQGADVHVTIGDHRLNIDPTKADTWTWNMGNGDKYYGTGVADAVDDADELNMASVEASLAYARTVADNAALITSAATQHVAGLPSPVDNVIISDRNGVFSQNGNIIASLKIVEDAAVSADTETASKTAYAEVLKIADSYQSLNGHYDSISGVPSLVDLEIADNINALRTAADNDNTAVGAINDAKNALRTNEVCASCSITVDYNRQGGDPIITIQGVEDQPLPAMEGWFTVREVSGPNTAVFSATNLSDESILKVIDNAARDSSATITYDGTTEDILVKHSTATIDIQSPDAVWTSGQAIPIVLVDGDVNKNSRDDNDIAVTDPNSIIPTLVTGTPFTLGTVPSEQIDWWIGWDIAERVDVTTTPENVTIAKFNLGLGSHGSLVTQQPEATVDSFSDRAKLTFLTSNNVAADEIEADLRSLGAITSDSTSITNTAFTNADNLIIDFGPGSVSNLLKYIIESDDPTTHGHNFINYNFESLNADVESIEIFSGATSVETITLENDQQQSGYTIALADTTSLNAGDKLDIQLNFEAPGLTINDFDATYPIVLDFFSFGFENDGEASDERIANQIIRLELEESDSDTGSLEGTLEYVMINQLNIIDSDTYAGLSTIGDEVSFIVIEDLTGSSAPSVVYLDVDTTGTETQVSAQEDAPSHSAVVTLDVESFKTADTVTVTLDDLDLNTNPNLVDIYTVVTTPGDANRDAVGEPYGTPSYDVELGRLLDITFDDERWTTQTGVNGDECTGKLADGEHSGLGETGFKLVETGQSTGVFVGTFAIPAEFCSENSKNPESVTGLDIEVNYVDFRDASGETTEVGDSAGVKANTGSVSLDRTVYPVPFGIPSDFDFNEVSTPADGNTDTRSVFPIHQSGMNGDGIADQTHQGLTTGEFLPQGDLVVYVTVTDPDFDVSASGKDSIAIAPCFTDSTPGTRNNDCLLTETATHNVTNDRSPVTVSVIRGSASLTVAEIGDASDPIDEIAPDAGIFESSVTIRYNMGPDSSLCPSTGVDLDDRGPNDNLNSCILQGDILQVEYRDPTDASGQPNTVTDSATFDLRNGVLQSDKSVYIIGSDMILTLIEPDLDLDSSQNETYDLDLIKWSSSAATLTMGDADDEIGAFDPEPLSFRETGPSTGIFQIVVEIPEALEGDSLQRGEEIDLEYTDWGPSGSDYVGDQDEDIRLTVFTSNFGATIDLDQKVYSWTDKVYITVVAPDHNFDDNLIDEIGESDEDPLRVATKGFDLDNYRLVETGFDTGIFTGEVILIGFDHGVFESSHSTGGAGPTDGYLETPSDGGISVSYEFSEDETVFTSSIIRWNIGDVQWLEASYPASGTGVLRVIDPDMNLNPEAVDNFDVNIASDTDASGITLTVTETNEATGIFEGTVFFTTTGGSSGHRLRVSEGDTVTADYSDATLPLPYTTSDQVSITSTTIIGTVVPPLERAPATNLRIVNTFGNSIDAVSTDQQVQIVADLSNGQDRDQDFAYLIQIQDSEGVTVSLSWIAGSLSPGQSFSPSASWTPTSVGTYDVTAFVWESIDNPTALSPPLSIDVSVN